jgi:hypothetical protein
LSVSPTCAGRFMHSPSTVLSKASVGSGSFMRRVERQDAVIVVFVL